MKHYSNQLTDNQMDQLIQEQMDSQTAIADIEESFLNDEISLSEASEAIVEIHKKLKKLLETFNQ